LGQGDHLFRQFQTASNLLSLVFGKGLPTGSQGNCQQNEEGEAPKGYYSIIHIVNAYAKMAKFLDILLFFDVITYLSGLK
jgi:hypothetical protein